MRASGEGRSEMIHPARTRFLSFPLLTLLVVYPIAGLAVSPTQESNQNDDRGFGHRAALGAGNNVQNNSSASKPEIVLQAGITSPQTQISFSPDARLLASMGKDGNSIKLWEVASGRLLRQLEGGMPSMGATSLARPFRFSADGRSLIAMADGKVRRWEVETGRELPGTALPTAKDFISAFLSEEGRILAAPSMDSSGVRLWDTTAGRELQPLTFDKDDRLDGQDTIALSPTGNVLATLTESVKASRKSIETTVEIRLWEVATGKKMQSLKVSSRPIQYGARGPSSRLSFSGDGAWLAMRSEALMRIWDVSSGRELKSFAAPRLASSNAADAPYE